MTGTKLEQLRSRFASLESCVVAFSGGVDSAVLTAVAHETLGAKMTAATGASPSVPSRDLEIARAFCGRRGIPHVILPTKELDNEAYSSNPSDRCFHCKSELFNVLQRLAHERGFKYVVEGTNASEIGGHRPGFLAACSNPNVVTPFVELRMTKEDVRSVARALCLEVAEKPSTACLSSRIPTGIRIEPDILKRVDEAENFLISLGLKQVRLRHHGDIARIETDDDGLKICMEKRGTVTEKIASLGWKNVTLDLKGYRTGGGM